MIARTVALLLCLCSALSADTQLLTVDAGIGEIRINAGDAADVTWEARQPIILRYLTYTLASGESTFVFCAEAGTQYVIVSDVIDWKNQELTKTTWIVTVGGEPAPNPVDPPFPPDPDVDPVPPDTVPNKYGIGPRVYAAAARLADKSAIDAVVSILKAAEKALHEGRSTSLVVLAQFEKAMGSRHASWDGVTTAISESSKEAAQQYGAGTGQFKNYIREARLTLELLK